MKVAVVRNHSFTGTINGFGRPSNDVGCEDTAQAISEDLREGGHTVIVAEGDKDLLPMLESFMPGRNGCPSGIVFNLSRGIQGDCGRSHVPAILEMAGIPYTGASPLGHALTFDRVVVRALLSRAGIPTPNHCIVRWPGDSTDRLAYPLLVKSRFEHSSFHRRVVRSERQLADAIDEVLTACDCEALVEEYAESVEVSVALLGNGNRMEFFPLVQQVREGDAPPQLSVAALGADVALRMRAIALSAFQLCRCQDYAQVDFRIDGNGNPVVVGVESMPALDADGLYVFAAAAAGCSRTALVEAILDTAHDRYFGVPAPRFDAPQEDDKALQQYETERP